MEVSVSCEPFYDNLNELRRYLTELFILSKEMHISVHFDLFNWDDNILSILGDNAYRIATHIHSRIPNLSRLLPQIFVFPFASISVHIEQYNGKKLEDLFSRIRNARIKCGIAFDLSTCVDHFSNEIKSADYITVMTTGLIKKDRNFNEEALGKIEKIKAMKEVNVIVDGGVSENTILSIRRNKADIFVTGSYAEKFYKDGMLAYGLKLLLV